MLWAVSSRLPWTVYFFTIFFLQKINSRLSDTGSKQYSVSITYSTKILQLISGKNNMISL